MEKITNNFLFHVIDELIEYNLSLKSIFKNVQGNVFEINYVNKHFLNMYNN